MSSFFSQETSNSPDGQDVLLGNASTRDACTEKLRRAVRCKKITGAIETSEALGSRATTAAAKKVGSETESRVWGLKDDAIALMWKSYSWQSTISPSAKAPTKDDKHAVKADSTDLVDAERDDSKD